MNLVIAEGRPEDRESLHYSEEFRAAVIADVVLLGPAATAAKYQLNQRLVHRWMKKYDTSTALALRQERIGNLLVAYLESNLQAQIAQAYVAADPEYLNRQPAESLAVLHRVLGDQSIRLLEALHRGLEEPEVIEGPTSADAG